MPPKLKKNNNDKIKQKRDIKHEVTAAEMAA